ncbi:MAG TPA: porin family protein [Bacteroidales bacterium]|nr:porin family protein [Bacteroidales bacterium]
MTHTIRKTAGIVITTLIIMVMVMPDIKAQESKAGIKGGLNLSWLTIDQANDNNIIPGFNAGVWGHLMMNEKFGIQPEVLYSGKGMKAVYNKDFLGFDVADGTTKLNLNYIDIPVYLTYNLAEDFNFHIGPYVGFLMNAHINTDSQILNFMNVNSSDDIDRSKFNTIDYGLAGGLGFSIDPLIFGFNYSIGLNQVAKDGESTEDLLGNAKNNTIQVYAGFVF